MFIVRRPDQKWQVTLQYAERGTCTHCVTSRLYMRDSYVHVVVETDSVSGLDPMFADIAPC